MTYFKFLQTAKTSAIARLFSLNEDNQRIGWYSLQITIHMGEPSAKSLNYKYPQFIYYETYTENGENRYNWGTKLTEEDLKKYFGITVKRFEFSKPIKNKFK